MALLVLMLVAALALSRAHDLSRWERDNGYPYGRLCDFYRTCKIG